MTTTQMNGWRRYRDVENWILSYILLRGLTAKILLHEIASLRQDDVR